MAEGAISVPDEDIHDLRRRGSRFERDADKVGEVVTIDVIRVALLRSSVQ